MCKCHSKEYFLINSIFVFILLLLLLLLLSLNPFYTFYKEAVALSPSFELQQMTNENHNWFQTYGNNDAHLKSNYTNILAVDYISNGKNLNATFWLASGFNKNSSASTYNQPFRRITYGMLIDADSNTKTGYNGADYDFYVESVAGKLSGYLYQLSSTGGYRLIGSKNFTQFVTDSSVGPGYANLQLDLRSLNSPSKYNLLFYTAESFKSNEVRQFTSWVNIPPPSLQITTSPSNITIRQGEEQLIPAMIKSTSGFSNDVINVTVAGNSNNNYYDIGSGFNSSELHVVAQRNQPPLFKIAVPRQTPLGIYTIPLIATIREPSVATITKPISINTRGGTVDPEFELSKKYPTVGYLTMPISLIVAVIVPRTISEQFKDFWATYGQFIGLFAGGFVGAYAKMIFDKSKKRHKGNDE